MYDNLTRTNLEFAHREAGVCDTSYGGGEMTFEEWKEKHNDLIENVAITIMSYDRGVDAKTFYDELECLLKKAFTAGRPKWHKVADGDLPSEEGGWVCNQNGLPCYFDWSTEQWLDCEGTPIRTTEWCHMPHKE